MYARMATVPPSPDWWNRVTQIFRFLSVQEVKTPLSFTFKSAFYLVALWVIILVWGKQSEAFDEWFVKFTALVFVVFCVGVGAFAWFNPVNLVYGETAHRAERKMEFGTEHKVLTEIEVETLPKSANTEVLSLPPKDG
jgi:hypothetical protein